MNEVAPRGSPRCAADPGSGKMDGAAIVRPALGAAASAVAVQKNVPMPPADRTGATKYPFASMAVGDSFAVPLGPKTAPIGCRDLRNAGRYFGRKRGTVYRVRLFEEAGKNVVRVWRVA